MATLQQTQTSVFNIPSDGEASILAIHRRSSTVLLLSRVEDGGNGKLILFSQQQHSEPIGVYLIGTNINAASHILGAVPLV